MNCPHITWILIGCWLYSSAAMAQPRPHNRTARPTVKPRLRNRKSIATRNSCQHWHFLDFSSYRRYYYAFEEKSCGNTRLYWTFGSHNDSYCVIWVKAKILTEAEAKRLHTAQLAAEGKTGIRRAYKRTQFNSHPNTPTLATAPATKDLPPVATPTAATKKAPTMAVPSGTHPPLRFIEHLVLERTGQ